MSLQHVLLLFLFCLSVSFTFGQENDSVDNPRKRLKSYKQLLNKEIINEVEYKQLKEELYRSTDLKNDLLQKARGQKIAGLILIPAGGGMIASGFIQNKKPVPEGPEDVYIQRKQRHKRTAIGIMAAGGISGMTGIILMSVGIANTKKIKTRNPNLNLEAGLLDSGNLGCLLHF